MRGAAFLCFFHHTRHQDTEAFYKGFSYPESVEGYESGGSTLAEMKNFFHFTFLAVWFLSPK